MELYVDFYMEILKMKILKMKMPSDDVMYWSYFKKLAAPFVYCSTQHVHLRLFLIGLEHKYRQQSEVDKLELLRQVKLVLYIHMVYDEDAAERFRRLEGQREEVDSDKL
ncbi:unnamed protein product [Dovyalis caffra]|uniref:Uncharacterized protein n=1 Tax=Dovyalis caffra TaxID=77055 RepID=A0AAV1RZR7_9ROSI|nr:unnamed protein product [Dovyalis caffra]